MLTPSETIYPPLLPGIQQNHPPPHYRHHQSHPPGRLGDKDCPDGFDTRPESRFLCLTEETRSCQEKGCVWDVCVVGGPWVGGQGAGAGMALKRPDGGEEGRKEEAQDRKRQRRQQFRHFTSACAGVGVGGEGTEGGGEGNRWPTVLAHHMNKVSTADSAHNCCRMGEHDDR
ncbi:hypothetical protein ACOMHN_041699 [Nucella lapillus]